jgi:hypothetical protein
MDPQTAGGLSTIDLLFCLLNDPRRPFDFTLVFHLTDAPSPERLRAGATSARKLFPATDARVEGKRWVRFETAEDGLEVVSARSDEEADAAVGRFVDAPLDPREQTPVQQLFIKGERGARLVTRFHHAAADGLSAAAWLGHQLRVAFGEEPPATVPAPFESLPLRSHPSPVKKSRFAFSKPSEPLRTPGSRPSRTRRWLSFDFGATDLRRACRRAGGFTYNDLLAACALEVFRLWNGSRGAGGGRRIGLWLPVNVRRRSAEGFGNGTSRIRLYARYDAAAPLAEKCREVRRQVSWCMQNGEWAVPERSPILSLPAWAAAPLMRAYVGRPGVDMATGVFSHAEGWAGARGEVFRVVEKIESIGQLHARHPVAFNGATHAGRTWLTLTYDPGLLTPEDAGRLAEMYRQQLGLARRELS